MKQAHSVQYWIEKMFGDLSSPSYDVAVNGNAFDIFGLPAHVEPRGTLRHTTSTPTEGLGTMARYVLQLDAGVTAEVTISRPPARLPRQHCMVRGRIDGLSSRHPPRQASR